MHKTEPQSSVKKEMETSKENLAKEML